MDQSSGVIGAYQAMRRRLAAAVRRLVGPSEVEDILQEAFLRCYEAESSQRVEHPSSYLLRTALNLAINHAGRAEQRLNSSLDRLMLEAEPGSGLDIEKQAMQRERLALYCRAVAELPLQCRRAFLLKKVYGLSQKEIAAYLGISENTVEKHVAKGLMHCASRVRDFESGSPARRGAKEGRNHG